MLFLYEGDIFIYSHCTFFQIFFAVLFQTTLLPAETRIWKLVVKRAVIFPTYESNTNKTLYVSMVIFIQSGNTT